MFITSDSSLPPQTPCDEDKCALLYFAVLRAVHVLAPWTP